MIYGEYAKTTGFMNAENLVEFLMKEQREKASLVDALKIIKECEPDEKGQCLAKVTCLFVCCVETAISVQKAYLLMNSKNKLHMCANTCSKC